MSGDLVQLIARVRAVYPAAVSLDDPLIESALLETAERVTAMELEPMPDVLPSGVVEYKKWKACEGGWGNDAVFQDGSWAYITPATSDPINGRWTFATHQQAVFLTGYVYDIYMACASLVRQYISTNAASLIDFTADGLTVRGSQTGDAMQKLAATFEQRARVRTAKIVRS